MHWCELLLPTPAENLACDEALLELAEAGAVGEVLRFWEPRHNFVVMGYANRLVTEVNLPFCQAQGIPILRRCTGGGTILQGPGCLNYSLILRTESNPPLMSIHTTNQFILQRHQAALQPLLERAIELQGHTDLALGQRKFSGNAQRRKKEFLLFHGTFLLDFDLPLLELVLPMPTRQPEYRRQRSHTEFLTNLKLPPEALKRALLNCWSPRQELAEAPSEIIEALVRDKYSRREWTFRF